MISEWKKGLGAPGRNGARGPSLAADEASLAARTQLSKWHVLQTRNRHEKAVAELMEEAGAQPFLPLVRRVVHYAHRRRTVEVPLFSNYIFVWGTPEDTYRAIASKHALKTVAVVDQETLSRELEQIRRAIAGEAAFSPYRFLERGVRVRVRSGPFKDLEGLVESGVKNDRLVLQIRTLGRATSMQIDASLLERLEDEDG